MTTTIAAFLLCIVGSGCLLSGWASGYRRGVRFARFEAELSRNDTWTSALPSVTVPDQEILEGTVVIPEQRLRLSQDTRDFILGMEQRTDSWIASWAAA